MADISNFIDTINRAVRGEEVRDAIIDAIENIANKNSSAGSLNGIDADQFVTREDLERLNITPLDNQPIEGSTHGVTSGGLYTYLQETLVDKGLMAIIGEKEKQFSSLADIVQYLDDIKAAIRKAIKGKLDSSQAGSLTKDTYFMDYATLIENLQTGATAKLETLTIDSPHEKYDDPYEPSEGYNGFDKVKVKIDFDNYRIKNKKVIGRSLEIDEETHLPKETFFKLKDEPEYEEADPDKKPVGYDDFSVDISDKLAEKPIEVDPASFGEEVVYNAYDDADTGNPFGWYKVTVRIKEATGPFTVTFYSSTDKSVKLYTATVEKPHQNAVYGGDDPDKYAPAGKVFKGWNPQPLNIIRDTDIYAEYGPKSKSEPGGDINETWEDIVKNGGKDIEIGAWTIIKVEPCSGEGYEINTEQPIIVQKVASGEGGSTSTWLARTPLMANVTAYQNSINQRVYSTSDLTSDANGYFGSPLRKFLNNVVSQHIKPWDDVGDDGVIAMAIKSVPKRYLGFYNISAKSEASTAAKAMLDRKPGSDAEERVWIPSAVELGATDKKFNREKAANAFTSAAGSNSVSYTVNNSLPAIDTSDIPSGIPLSDDTLLRTAAVYVGYLVHQYDKEIGGTKRKCFEIYDCGNMKRRIEYDGTKSETDQSEVYKWLRDNYSNAKEGEYIGEYIVSWRKIGSGIYGDTTNNESTLYRAANSCVDDPPTISSFLNLSPVLRSNMKTYPIIIGFCT